MDKVLYKDGEKDRLLKGQITAEDDFFISIKLTDVVYRINKANIISIRQGEYNGKNKNYNISK
jgi:hypothetical protein